MTTLMQRLEEEIKHLEAKAPNSRVLQDDKRQLAGYKDTEQTPSEYKAFFKGVSPSSALSEKP